MYDNESIGTGSIARDGLRHEHAMASDPRRVLRCEDLVMARRHGVTCAATESLAIRRDRGMWISPSVVSMARDGHVPARDRLERSELAPKGSATGDRRVHANTSRGDKCAIGRGR